MLAFKQNIIHQFGFHMLSPKTGSINSIVSNVTLGRSVL